MLPGLIFSQTLLFHDSSTVPVQLKTGNCTQNFSQYLGHFLGHKTNNRNRLPEAPTGNYLNRTVPLIFDEHRSDINMCFLR